MLLQEKAESAGRHPSGFDYLRLILAVAVVALHIPIVEYGDAFATDFWMTWRRPFLALVLPMFFALSGFLVAGSMVRSKSLFGFLGLRMIRILPALSVEVVLSAFVLGPIFTVLSLPDYFQSAVFFKYFLNFVGHVQFVLPGVFEANPHPRMVNQQLWTIPWELRCYLLIVGLALLGAFRKRVHLLILALVLNATVLFFSVGTVLPDQVSVPGVVLVESFLAGIVFFVFADRVPHSAALFFGSLLCSVVLLLVPGGDYLVSLPAGYVTVYLGLLNPVRGKLLHNGDYSYGIYLYGFPIQQAVAAVNGVDRAWYFDALCAVPLIFSIAAFSWWIVEKPTLAWRKYLPAMEAYCRRKASLAGLGIKRT